MVYRMSLLLTFYFFKIISIQTHSTLTYSKSGLRLHDMQRNIKKSAVVACFFFQKLAVALDKHGCCYEHMTGQFEANT